MSESLNLNNVDMHSDEWWMRAMDGALTLEEQQAWEGHLLQCAACREEWQALMELDQLFESVPVAVPPADFTAKTLVRLDATRRRRRLWSFLGIVFLGLVVLTVEILMFGNAYIDIRRVVLAVVASQDLLAQALMRVTVGLIAFGKTLVPFLLGAAGLLTFFMMPNGALATVAVFAVRQRRRRQAAQR